MTVQRPPSLGECPSCGVQLANQHVLIQYEREDGKAVYADCPGCREVVSPA